MSSSQVAQKAVQTRQARQRFVNRYGVQTLNIIRMLNRNTNSAQVALKLNVPRQAVAAVKAHLSMKTYDALLIGCNV